MVTSPSCRSWVLLSLGQCLAQTVLLLAGGSNMHAQTVDPPEVIARYFCCESHVQPQSSLPGIRNLADKILSLLETFNVVTLDNDPRPGMILDLDTAAYDTKTAFWGSSINSKPPEQKVLQLHLYTGHGFMVPDHTGNPLSHRLAFRDGLPEGTVKGKKVYLMVNELKSLADEQRPCIVILDACRDPAPGHDNISSTEPLPGGKNGLWVFYTTAIGKPAGAQVFQRALLSVLERVSGTTIAFGKVLKMVSEEMEKATHDNQSLVSALGNSWGEYAIPFQLVPKQPDPRKLSYQSASNLASTFLVNLSNTHDIGTPITWSTASAQVAVSDYISKQRAELPADFGDHSKLSSFNFPETGYQRTCEFRSGKPMSRDYVVVERSAEKPVLSQLYNDAKDMTLDTNIFLEEDTTLEFRDLTIKKGVRLITNGHSLNIRILGNLKAENFDIVSFETDRAAAGLPGKPGYLNSPGGNGADGFTGRAAGASTFTVLGSAANGTLIVRMPGLSGGNGGAGGKGGVGADSPNGAAGRGFPGGNGGAGGNGGDGGILSITLPTTARETFVVQQFITSGGEGGIGGSPGPRGEPGQSPTERGLAGSSGSVGRNGTPGKPGKVLVGYGGATSGGH